MKEARIVFRCVVATLSGLAPLSTSSPRTVSCPCRAAVMAGVGHTLLCPASSTGQPAPTSSRTVARWPPAAAMWSAVPPYLFRAPATSASPAPSSSCTTAAWPWWAACNQSQVSTGSRDTCPPITRLVQRGPARARPLVEVGPAAHQRRHQRLVTVGGGHVQRTDLALVSRVDTDLARLRKFTYNLRLVVTPPPSPAGWSPPWPCPRPGRPPAGCGGCAPWCGPLCNW